MKRLASKLALIGPLLVGLGLLTWLSVALHQRIRPNHGLPFRSDFRQALSEWTAQGGDWGVANGVVVNYSNEIGSRLLTGSESLTNYNLDTDVKLTNSYGDAGVVVRVTQSEEGTNSFYGYYAGLRLPDTLLLARMDYGYQPLRTVKLPEPVVPGRWYHLSVQARDCTFSVTASGLPNRLLASAEAVDRDECQMHGNFGLRSFAAGGSWRDVRVDAVR